MGGDDGRVNGGGWLLGVGECLEYPPMFCTQVAQEDDEEYGDREDQGDNGDEVGEDQG